MLTIAPPCLQIWFQNRRQNDRRKSRPLSPQEIAALQYGGMQAMPASDPPSAPYATNPPLPSSSLPTAQDTSPAPPSSAPERDNASPPAVTRPDVPEENTVEQAETRDIRRESLASVGIPVGPSSQPVEFTASPQPHQLYRSNSVGYFANRLHAGTAFQPCPRSPDSYR